MNGRYGWHAAAADVAEVVRTAAPRVAVVAAVTVMLLAVPVLLRLWVFVPW